METPITAALFDDSAKRRVPKVSVASGRRSRLAASTRAFAAATSAAARATESGVPVSARTCGTSTDSNQPAVTETGSGFPVMRARFACARVKERSALPNLTEALIRATSARCSSIGEAFPASTRSRAACAAFSASSNPFLATARRRSAVTAAIYASVARWVTSARVAATPRLTAVRSACATRRRALRLPPSSIGISTLRVRSPPPKPAYGPEPMTFSASSDSDGLGL